MPEHTPQPTNYHNEEITLRDIAIKARNLVNYLKRKWLIILVAGMIGGGIGYLNAYFETPYYVAALSFVQEEDNSGPGGGGALAGASGLASSLGLDMGGNSGSVFSGSNLIELMKSRTLVEKALLDPITVNGKVLSLAEYFMQFNGINKGWETDPSLKNLRLEPLSDRSKFTRQQDSIMGRLHKMITDPKSGLTVLQKDKKISIITMEVKSVNEVFAKAFVESLSKVVSEFYIQTKSKKARNNVALIEKQVDSIRAVINGGITTSAVTSDNTFNLNPGLNAQRAPSTKSQVVIQSNTVILTQMVSNLAMAKLTLLKETPLIQVIDYPILPLPMVRSGKLAGLITGGILGVIMMIVILSSRRAIKDLYTGID